MVYSHLCRLKLGTCARGDPDITRQ